jgi:hypothetical protein
VHCFGRGAGGNDFTIEPREMIRNERSLADEFGEAIAHPVEIENSLNRGKPAEA